MLCQSLSVVAVAPAPMTSRIYSALPKQLDENTTFNMLHLRVRVGWTGISSITLEIIDQSRSICSDVAKVDSLASFPEKQKPVEFLE